MIIKLDSSNPTATYSKGIVIDRTEDSSSITPFDTILNKAQSYHSAWDPESDKIIKASDLTDEERLKLYSSLGISSPAGTSVVSNTDDVQQYSSDSQSSNCSVKVPSDLVSIFEDASKAYGVSYDLLVSVAKAESDFNSSCKSKSGAMGIMQLMPATAKYLGVNNAYDAKENIMGGAKYLAEKLKEHGSIKLGLAAYNAGSNAVEKYGGIPPYSETQNYVKKILSYIGNDGSGTGLLNSVQTTSDENKEDNSIKTEQPEGATVTIAGVKMTYTAYLKYLDLMNLGVG